MDDRYLDFSVLGQTDFESTPTFMTLTVYAKETVGQLRNDTMFFTVTLRVSDGDTVGSLPLDSYYCYFPPLIRRMWRSHR